MGKVNVRKNLNFYVLLLIVSHYLPTRQIKSLYAKYVPFLLVLQSFGKKIATY